MKKIIYIIAVFSALFICDAAAFSQCDRNAQGPIRCGYFDEGYQDGSGDARANRSSDYRRYRNKFESQYESFYRTGYDAGYSSGKPTYPPYPSPGGGGGGNSASWSGRVDGTAQIIIQGNNIRAQDTSGSGLQTDYQNMNGDLPRRSVLVTANKVSGRGTVSVVQQPSRQNGYTAIIQISDPRGGADNYRVDISWQRGQQGGGDEAYRSGRVLWRGRVDQTANIVVSGNNVSTEWVAGRQISGETFNITGYLARRPGTVRVRKIDGRGSVTVLQQPSWENDFSAVIQVSDPDGSDDNYQVEITW